MSARHRFAASMLALLPFSAVFLADHCGASEPARPAPVVVELFTSEGCSSCPPADALLIRLEKLQPVPNARILVLSEHVDYWNRLGWKDPFSSKQFSERQTEYAEAFGNEGVYTPQMVVDGQAEFVGSDAARAHATIAQAADRPKIPLDVRALASEGQRVRIRVELSTGLPKGTALLLALTEANLSVAVPRGENAGRTIAHTGVVRLLKMLPGKEGATSFEQEWDLSSEWNRAHLSAVAFLQEQASRRITGAAIARLVTE